MGTNGPEPYRQLWMQCSMPGHEHIEYQKNVRWNVRVYARKNVRICICHLYFQMMCQKITRRQTRLVMKFLSKFWCEQLGTWQIRHGFDLLPGYNITAGCWEQLPPMLERLVSPLGGLTRRKILFELSRNRL